MKTTVTYIIHKYAGTSKDKTVTVAGAAAEEIARLRQEIAELLYRNQTADAEIVRLQKACQ